MQLDLFPVQMTKKQEKEYNELSKELEKRFERHDHILKHGAGDPFWCDGTGLMLVRSHILSYKRKLYDLHLETTMPLPEVALKPTPPEYPLDYCVNCRPHHR
ncbi:MAG: hypothetical protein QM401_00810 [Bacillota bacterium]|nr:hypothetical protein [Bacillota bacterium]